MSELEIYRQRAKTWLEGMAPNYARAARAGNSVEQDLALGREYMAAKFDAGFAGINWPVDIGGAAALMLGPIAVERALQGQGLALALMQTSLDAARALGHRIVVLVGDEPYYGRAGFKQIMPLGCVTMPGPVDPARLLGLALVGDALEGLQGEMRKAWLDHPVSALGAALAPRVDAKT